MNGYDQCSDEELIRRLHAGEEGISDYLMEKYKELFFSPEIFLRDKEGLIVCKVG